MTILTEDPGPALVAGVFALVILSIALFQTRRVGVLYLMAAVVIINTALFLVERLVTTPREEIESTITAIAADLQANDVARVLQHLGSSAAGLRRDAQQQLRRAVVHEVRIKHNLTVEFSADQTQATAKFNAVMVASERNGSIQRQLIPRFVVLELDKESDGWRVVGYRTSDARDGMRLRDR